MTGIDPKNPPPWITRLIDRAVDRKGESFRVEARKIDGKGGANVVSLGVGTFVAPLPEEWSLRPERPYEGRIRVKEGYDIHYRVDSHEDAEAAKGGPQLLRYADEPEFKDDVKTPEDVLRDILISIPGRDPLGKEIVWKWVDPRFGTHVRELLLRCPLINDELVEHRISIGHAIGEWLQLGGFSPELTALDRVAHTAALTRVNFEDTVLMRVPRAWKVDDASDPGDERRLYAVDEPQDRETLWVTSQVVDLPDYDDERIPRAGMAKIVDGVWKSIQANDTKRWLTRRREELADGDILIVTANEEEERGEPLRRITWIRYAIRDDAMIWAPIHLVTAAKYLQERAQIEMEALVDREVRNAIILRPPHRT